MGVRTWLPRETLNEVTTRGQIGLNAEGRVGPLERLSAFVELLIRVCDRARGEALVRCRQSGHAVDHQRGVADARRAPGVGAVIQEVEQRVRLRDGHGRGVIAGVRRAVLACLIGPRVLPLPLARVAGTATVAEPPPVMLATSWANFDTVW